MLTLIVLFLAAGIAALALQKLWQPRGRSHHAPGALVHDTSGPMAPHFDDAPANSLRTDSPSPEPASPRDAA